jgi:hypothetical protein
MHVPRRNLCAVELPIRIVAGGSHNIAPTATAITLHIDISRTAVIRISRVSTRRVGNGSDHHTLGITRESDGLVDIATTISGCVIALHVLVTVDPHTINPDITQNSVSQHIARHQWD